MHNLSLYHNHNHSVDSDPLLEYMPLVKQVALHLSARLPASVDIDDLIQVGMIGLLESLQNYDASKGAQFETFAKLRVRGAMLDEMRRFSTLPRSVIAPKASTDAVCHSSSLVSYLLRFSSSLPPYLRPC